MTVTALQVADVRFFLSGELIKSSFVMSASSQLIQIDLAPKVRSPKPSWLKAKAPVGDNFHNLKKLARGLGLHTVCESAQCPNIGECWDHHTATFMLLGDICTRRCGFCAVPKGRPEEIDWDEPRRVAEAVATLGPVSYTHLDVYKRQRLRCCPVANGARVNVVPPEFIAGL